MAETSYETNGPPVPPPMNMSFLFSIQDIRPNPRRQTRGEYLPRRANAIQTVQNVQRPIYRWSRGTITPAVGWTYARLTTAAYHPYHFRTATVFTSQQRFLSVNFDARQEDVKDSDMGKWVPLDFHYTRDHQSNRFYSFLDCPGEHTKMAASGTSHWIRQLFPQGYHRALPAAPSATTIVNAGLTGQLPLILAVAAYSCPPQSVDFVLQHCIEPRRWKQHSADPDCELEGLFSQEVCFELCTHSNIGNTSRGMVVTIWREPNSTTTDEQLRNLESGVYGPIFGP